MSVDSDLEHFQRETRSWLEANCPASQRLPPVEEEQIWGGRRRQFPSADARLWFERMRDRGWTVPNWPKAYGGAGLDAKQHDILKREMRRLGCRTPLNDLGIFMLGPALLEHASEAQNAEHLPKIARGEIRWCQGYSEPGAGSDLASLQCKAEDKGDHFLVNGSKIWTSYADKSDWIFCLVRTDPNAKKQEGISFLLIDMDDPGVVAKPIELISGSSHFCQVWLDNVKVPKANLVGELNKGWTVAKAVLKHERKLMAENNNAGDNETVTPRSLLKQFIGLDSKGKLANAELRQKLASVEMEERAAKLCERRIYESLMAGEQTSLPTLMKKLNTELIQKQDELRLAAMGNRGMAWDGDSLTDAERDVPRNWAMAKAWTIAGGTSEVQLNIIAKNVLGLPD